MENRARGSGTLRVAAAGVSWRGWEAMVSAVAARKRLE